MSSSFRFECRSQPIPQASPQQIPQPIPQTLKFTTQFDTKPTTHHAYSTGTSSWSGQNPSQRSFGSHSHFVDWQISWTGIHSCGLFCSQLPGRHGRWNQNDRRSSQREHSKSQLDQFCLSNPAPCININIHLSFASFIFFFFFCNHQRQPKSNFQFQIKQQQIGHTKFTFQKKKGSIIHNLITLDP